ncbi:RloB domain-containing protein [Xanthomonas sp. GPE 39]|uniref:RloB domain-containing protein n=1 Tax=Xanthomonas sp. GPE 39 TaxID=1583099 RepID=UPI0013791AA7|nr:RloB domain-containing protein [Xanthomonas sp. GPE 39]
MRTVKETLLIVCEGDAEMAFVRFVKRTYADALGRNVQEKNAHGKGGKHVLETGLSIANNNNRTYNKLVLLLDTDTDWNDALRAKAQNARVGKRPVSVIEADPCLEAWLLDILDIQAEGDTLHMKQKFKAKTGVEAHEPAWINKHLSRETLDEARTRVSQLADLMNHMGIARNC